jgi:hypothetical protein
MNEWMNELFYVKKNEISFFIAIYVVNFLPSILYIVRIISKMGKLTEMCGLVH